ncbi:unnamed protein product [Lymnaea stagnalis]|uniref:Uncharacterized protein n=1 Tax=Lymnaea stagnalis TaxID=6523 RepID=A0AAV2HVK4_LYMST
MMTVIALCLVIGYLKHTDIYAAAQEFDGGNVTEANYYAMVASSEYSADGVVPVAPFGYRPGVATSTNSCQFVRGVPNNLRSHSEMKPAGLSMFYQKYTEAYGIPVVSSMYVPDDALRRACYTLRFLLAGHAVVRQSFYILSGRVAVLSRYEGTTSIPEHSNLPAWWNIRARGLGATTHAPVSSSGEENILCSDNDWYREQDIFLHEASHGVHLLGAVFAIPGWDQRLRRLFNESKSRGLWANTYSMASPEEYFAEGTQSYFNVNSYVPVPDGVRGPINDRNKLMTYDPQLYSMIREIFPCDNVYLKRCFTSRVQEDRQVLQMDCDQTAPVGPGK